MRTIFFFCFLTFILPKLLPAQQQIEQWEVFEATFKHAPKDNGFLDVKLTAIFSGADTNYTVTGFYDGSDIFRIRFMPTRTGTWHFVTSSNIPQLNNRKGKFECVKATANNHGMVQVVNLHNFAYADGTPYYPFGTTAYAWTHMGNELQEMTLRSLGKSGFNKIRMCVFPKNYQLVSEKPRLFPFEIKEISKDNSDNEKQVFDFTRFSPAFFQHLEKRISDLGKLGIEADLILFHPYDKGRWGFDAMPREVNMRYIQYLCSRLSAYKNVWWSLANEWDLVKTKTKADWNLLAKTVVASDPYRHLCSIHGSTAKYFEYWQPEFTHVSVQDEAPVLTATSAALVRNIYKKPVICDEVGYEGNLKSRWGRYSPEKMFALVLNGIMGGIYVTHGETYMFHDASDTISWAKGGMFKGESWKRIAFLRKIVEAAPNALQMADVSRDFHTTTAGDNYYFVHFGTEMKEAWLFNLPVKNAQYEKIQPGARFKVEIIDMWDMTVTTYPYTFETGKENDYRVYDKEMKKVYLPLKPFIVLRITAIK